MIAYGRPRRERWYPMVSPDCPPPMTRVSTYSLPGPSVMWLPPWISAPYRLYSNLEYNILSFRVCQEVEMKEVGMKDQLTTTSYAVLAQVAVRPWSTYELAQQRVRYFRYVWPRAESAIYREAKRLSSMGLIEGKKEYTGKRARTVYSITREGKEALREWLGTPVSPFSMDFEAILRLFIASLGTKDDIMSTLKQVHADTQEMLRFAGEVKQEFIDGINPTQDQVYIRALAVDFFISLLNTVDAWAERTLAEIETWDDLMPSDEKNARGLEKIRQLPVDTPEEALKDISIPPKRQTRSRS